MDIVVHHDPDRSHFTADLEDTVSSLFYAHADEGVVDFVSTWVDPAVRGRSVGMRLVTTALDWARSEGLTVVPSCWYVGVVVRRRPEYRDLIRTSGEP